MNSIFCPCHPICANQRGNCCTNCGQQHFGAVPCLVQPNGCCPTKPCMLCCSFNDQNILALFKEFPSKDHIGNRNPAHVLTMLNNNSYDGSEQSYRAYSIASSNVDRDLNTSFTPDISDIPTYSSNNQRSYLLSQQSNEVEKYNGNSFFKNVSFIREGNKSISNPPSTTSLNDDIDIIDYGQNLANYSTASTMDCIPISRTSLPWLYNLTSASTYGNGHYTAIEQLLLHQAGELAEMRHNQEQELIYLHEEEPTSQLRDRIEDLMEKQLEDQLSLQKKHRRQLEEEEEPVKEQKQSRSGDYYNNNSNSSLIRISDNMECSSTCGMQQGDGAKRNQATSISTGSYDFDRNPKQVNENTQSDHNTGGCLDYSSGHNVFGGQIGSGGSADVANISCDCNKSNSKERGPLPSNPQTCGQYQGVSKRHDSDPLRDIRMSVFESEITEGQKARQQIADAMAELTVNYRKDVVLRTAQQTEENATKAFEQRQRDAEASVHTAQLQIEKDSIDATLLWLLEAKKAAEVEISKERKQVEDLAIKEAKLQEEIMIQLKHREIDLTEAAIQRQLAQEEAIAVLRQVKNDELERAKQRKREMFNAKSLHEIAFADLMARRKTAEMNAQDVTNMRKHEKGEALKNRVAIEKAIARQHAIQAAITAADAHRRKDYDVDSNAQRQFILKKAILRRDMEAIRADARRTDAEEEAAAAASWRREEDALLNQGHKAMLQEAAKRRKEEEQALVAQKQQLIQDTANERAIRQKTLQAQQKETEAKLKLKIAADAERKERQRKEQLEALQPTVVKRIEQDQSIDRSPEQIMAAPANTMEDQTLPKSSMSRPNLKQNATSGRLPEAKKSMVRVRGMSLVQEPLDTKDKNKKQPQSKGAGPSAQMIREAQVLANKMAAKKQTNENPPRSKQKLVHLTKSQQQRLAARKRK